MTMLLRSWFVLSVAGTVVAACGADSADNDASDTGLDGTADAVPDGTADAPPDEAVPDAEPDADGVADESAGEDDGGPGDGSTACPRPSDPGPGDHTLPLEFGGLSRSFIVHVPPGYDAAEPTPLVVNFHGYTSNAAQQVFFSNMNPTADAHGFVVLYPDGYANSWNAGSCCGDAAAEGIDDVGFAGALIDEAARVLCIDRERVYAAGMSNGGFMSYRLACETTGIFAGFAPVAGGIGMPDCRPARPVSLVAYHGTADSYVPFSFGETSFHQYAVLAGCTGDPVRTAHGTSWCDVYESCEGGIRVGFCALDGMDHCWPGGAAPRTICETFIGAYSEDLNANEHLWEFLGP